MGEVRSVCADQGPISTSGKMSYCKISQSIEAARFVLKIVRSIALKIVRHGGNSNVDVPVKFQSDALISTLNLADLKLHQILP